MLTKEYYDILLDSVPRDTGLRVARIVHGVSWTAAQLNDGRCGVGMHTQGESFPRRFETLEGLPLERAAEALLSWNLEEASEGMAVVNAWFNRPEHAESLGGFYTENALAGIPLEGRTVGFVGQLIRHSGISEALLAPAKRYYILEREPKSGDYPDSACEYLLPECDLVVITGSAAINKTLPRLLELSRDAEVVLTGPSVTLCPALPGPCGIRRLNGQAITEGEAMLSKIVEERCSVNAFSRHYTLDYAAHR